jgi:hypothetical protein
MELEHCGLCNELPGHTFSFLRDSSISEEVAEQAVKDRRADLRMRKEMGAEAWLKE